MKQNYFKGLRALLYAGVLLTGLLGSRLAQAQSYLLPTSGLTTVTTCSGTLYDNGGSTGTYSSYASGGTTVVPATAGSKVMLQFSQFDVDSYYDYVRIYDGSSMSAPLIGEFNNNNIPTTIYASNSAGTLTVVLESDSYYNYSGFAAAISCVTTVPQADLAVQGATALPLSTVAGNSVSVSCYIYNLSGLTAYTSSVGYYFSTDAVLDASDVLLGNSTGGSLAVNGYSSRYSTVTIPATATPGSYYMLFVADYLNQVGESNELNNVTTVNITVTPPSIDLSIQQATVSPLNTAVGTPITMNCYISNSGNATANSSSVGFYISTDQTLDAADILLTTQYGGQLSTTYSSSRYGTAAIPPGLTPGTYYILFAADYQNQVTETNENNNVTAVAITVAPPGVDLVVQVPYLYPSYSAAGATIQASATIANQGNVTATSSGMGFYISTDQVLDASDVLLNSVTGTQLLANNTSYRSSNLVVPATTAPGSYYILFVADPQGLVTETDETNNLSTAVLTVVAPTIDLDIWSAYASPTTVLAGGSTSLSCYLENTGNAPATPANIGYYLSTDAILSANDVALGTLQTTSIAGGGYLSRYSNVTIPTGTAAGSYYVLFVADPQNAVAETNENNNVAYATIQVTAPGIDLQMGSAYATPYTLSAGASVSLSGYIYNAGTLAASSSATGYYLSTNTTLDANDVLLTTTPGSQLNAGVGNYLSATATIPAATNSGYYYILFVADPQNVVSETIETNNLSYVSIQVVTPSIDLQLGQLYLGSTSVTPGISTSVSLYAYNAGNTSSPSSDVSFYLSANSVLDASDVLLTTVAGGYLYAGNSNSVTGSVTIPVNTTAGTYYLLAKVDPQNAVTETNENNNVTYSQFTVTGPFTGVVVPFTGSNTITTCNTTVYDHAGFGYYSNYANGTLTILPGTTNSRVQLTFSMFSVESCCDALYVYDGSSSSAPLLATLQYMPSQPLVATNSAGALTLVFITDGSATYPGFEAAVACVTNSGTLPDLLIGQVGATTNQAPAGGSFTLNTSITNQGNLAASNVAIGYYLSTNQTLDAADVQLNVSTSTTTMTAGQTATRTATAAVPGSTVPGSYYLLAVADPQNLIGESNENNNVSATAVSITTRTATREETAGYTVAAYPNPVAQGDALQLILSGAGTTHQATLTLLNTLGQEVRKQNLTLRAGTDNRVTVAHEGLASGLYTLRLTGDNLSVVRTVVFE